MTQVTTSQASASSRVPASQPSSPASAPGGLGVGVEADARAVLGGRQAARRPGAVQAAADDADAAGVLARELLGGEGRDGARAQGGDGADVDEGERRPSSADDTQIIPITTGSPARGLPGNDVTHLRIATPPPLAGMARKSPCGGASR